MRYTPVISVGSCDDRLHEVSAKVMLVHGSLRSL